MNTDSGHTLVNLAVSNTCRVDHCECGTFHIQIQNVSFKLNREKYLEICRTMGLASEPLLARELKLN